ncbi:hypothetical protein [Cupriavidus sp. H39]
MQGAKTVASRKRIIVVDTAIVVAFGEADNRDYLRDDKEKL